MKTTRILSLASVLVFGVLCGVSCKKETSQTRVSPVVETVKNAPIVFHAGGLDVDVETRTVTESTASVLQTNGFKVAAVQSDNNVLFNTAVSYANEVWSPATTYYYPSDGTMSFYAAYPGSQAVSVNGSGAATIAYSQNADTDLVAAKRTAVAASASPVALTFDHILSQASVTCTGGDDNADYVVTAISITAPASGTYAYSSGTWGSLGTSTAYSYFSGSTALTSEKQAFGAAMTFIPGSVTLTVSWTTLQNSVVIAEYTKSVAVTLTKGKNTTINATLPNNDANTITFTIAVTPWTSEEQNITLDD